MFEVLGFYKFVKIRSLKKNKVLLQAFLINKKIRGTIIIASEGINGTISGKVKDVKSIINNLSYGYRTNNGISRYGNLFRSSFISCGTK